MVFREAQDRLELRNDRPQHSRPQNPLPPMNSHSSILLLMQSEVSSKPPPLSVLALRSKSLALRALHGPHRPRFPSSRSILHFWDFLPVSLQSLTDRSIDDSFHLAIAKFGLRLASNCG